MRVAPVALLLRGEMVRSCAVACFALTHGNPTGQLAVAAWAEMLRDVAEGADLATAAKGIARDHATDFGDETSQTITQALNAPRDGQTETVEALGGGWVAEEALAITLYACVTGWNFGHAVQIAVTHGGDSDSTGAIAGNILGLLCPEQVLAHR